MRVVRRARHDDIVHAALAIRGRRGGHGRWTEGKGEGQRRKEDLSFDRSSLVPQASHRRPIVKNTKRNTMDAKKEEKLDGERGGEPN